MSVPDMPAPWEFEFETLMRRLLDSRLDAAEQTRLNALLAESPAAMDAYLQLMRLDTLLRYRNAPPGAASPAVLTGEASVSASSPLMGESRGEGLPSAKPASPTKSPVLGFLGGVIDYVSHSRTLMFWLIGGSLGLYFAVQLGSLLVSRFWAQNAAQLADDRGAGTEKHGHRGNQPGLGAATGAKIVARLTNAVDCQWNTGEPDQPSPIRGEGAVTLDVGTQFSAGQRLNLTAGLAELTFDSGAKVILHAPARFDVTDALGGDLQVGRLTAKVPHSAAGFTIATPGGKVVDLGTEFGVKVTDDRQMHVIVYVGQVEVQSASASVGRAASPSETAPVTVKAGEAIVIGPGQPAKRIPPQDERFIRDLEPLGDKSKAEVAYVEYMKSLKPVVWFRMEGSETDRVLHDEMGGPDAKLNWDGPGNPFVKGAIGKGLWLRGNPVKDAGAIVADYPKADHDKLTVSLWAYADGIPAGANSCMVCNWDDSREPSGQFYIGLTARRPRAVLSATIQPREGRAPWIEEDYDHPFPLQKWQHVAFVHDGNTFRLYRQGREIVARPRQHVGLRYPTNIKALAIGARLNAAGDAASRTSSDRWAGKLDEIAVFNDALSAADIRKLAAFGP